MPYYTQIGGKKYDSALLKAFERSTQGQGDGRVSGNDVKAEIQKRVQDGGKLTEVEIETLRYAADKFNITSRGQSELSELVQGLSGQDVFAWQNTGNVVGTQATGQLDAKALNTAVAQFVIDHASDGASVDSGKIFPGVDSSNMGLFAYTLDGESAERVMTFAKATAYSNMKAKLEDYDPTQHAVMAVRVTFDEEALFVGLVDRATGEVTVAGDLAYVDAIDESSFDDADDFEAKTGIKLADISGADRDYWYELPEEEVAQHLLRGGRLLDLNKGDDVLGRPSVAALESAAWDLDTEWGDSNIMDGAVEAKAGQIPFGMGLGQTAVRIMEQELRWDDMTWSKPPSAGAERGVTDAVIKQAAKMVNEGFGYDPSNAGLLSETQDQVESLVEKLGRRGDLKLVVAEGEGTPDHITGSDPLLTKTFLFFNDKSGDFFAVTARDSTL